MKHLFIINPAAGKGKAINYEHSIRNYFKDKPDQYFIERTNYEGHATELVKAYVTKDCYRVYSIGGDGTLNEVLNGLIGYDSALAVIPAGSGNDFFRNIEDNSDESLLLRTIQGTERLIDVCKVNERYFLNVASAGIDAEVVHNADRFKKLPFLNGMSAYVAGVFYTVFKYKSFNSLITINGKQYNKRTLLIAVANGKYYGGGMKIAPKANINDNKFEVYHVDNASPLRIIYLFPRLIKGTHEGIKEVTYYSADMVTISSTKGFTLNIDGEILKAKEATFEILKEKLKLVKPLSK